jgi:cation-transporting ATPase 13A2
MNLSRFMIVWCSEEYYAFSVVIFLTTAGSILLGTKEMSFNLERLRELAGRGGDVWLMKPDGGYTLISDRTLIPGDKYIVQSHSAVPCDTLLCSGRVAVNESSLTGESVPITKHPINVGLATRESAESPDLSVKFASNILFSGTKTIQISGGSEINRQTLLAIDELVSNDASLSASQNRPSFHSSSPVTCYPIGLVYKTGFRSAKGRLVASLLNPKEELMGFVSDALTIILLMFCLATGLYIFTGEYNKCIYVRKMFDSLKCIVLIVN